MHLGKIGGDDIDLVKQMNEIQKHRGPDDEGIYCDDFCCLGHRRLSIIDLSANGHQPFKSDDGRFVITYNGEIYNYIELREELEREGWVFKTKTDTEVLLKAYQQFGKDCLSRFNGMFAFAIYDTRQRVLFLARDRIGVKPLYYVLLKDKLYFASEIKALRIIPSLQGSVNHQALFDYLVFNRTDIHDETFIVEIKRLPKGFYGIWDTDGLKLTQWWDPCVYAREETNESFDEIVSKVEDKVVSAVRLRMRSDVPIGSCLSGGLDSSILVGILFDRLGLTDHYVTFTVSFPGHKVDETKYIKCLNQRYPFVNYQAFPSARGAYDNLKEFVYVNDEPTTGPSFYSQYELMKLVKQKGITVLLDGQGGDENFAGYQYFHGFYLNGLIKKRQYAKFLYNFLKIMIRGQDKTAYQTLLFELLSDSWRRQSVFRYHPYMQFDFFNDYIRTSRIYNEFFDAPDLNMSLVRHFQYKLEHLLRMEDRNSMARSIETRLPYLDYRLVEYVLSVPADMKIKAGETKYLQKQSLQKYTVPEILNRKDKIGFGTPDEWLQMPFWREKIKDSARYCAKTFPDVFQRNLWEVLPKNATYLWKIDQLAIWHQMMGL